MAKGFKVPSFSVPKVSIPTAVTVKVPDVNLDKIPGGSNIKNLTSQVDIPEMSDLKSGLSGMGINSVADAKKMFLGGNGDSITIKIPSKEELKETATSKVETAKTIVQTAREQGIKEGLKAAIPQDYKDMKQTLEDSGMSFDVGSLKEKFKGGD